MESIYNTLELIGFIIVLLAWLISLVTGKRINKKMLNDLLKNQKTDNLVTEIKEIKNDLKEVKSKIENVEQNLETLEVTVKLDNYANNFRINAYQKLDQVIDNLTITNGSLKELYIKGKIAGVDYFLNLLKINFNNFNKQRIREEMLTLFSSLSDTMEFNHLKRDRDKILLKKFIKKEKEAVIVPEINNYLDNLTIIVTQKVNGERLKAFCEISINFMINIIIKTDKIYNSLINLKN